MRLDELKQPLRRRSLGERLWAKRPGSITLAYACTAAIFLGLGLWAARHPQPFAGEPIVVAAIPTIEEVTTASTDSPEIKGGNVSEVARTPTDQVAIDQSSDGQVQDEQGAQNASNPDIKIIRRVEQASDNQDAALVIAPRRSLTPAPASGLVEAASVGGLPKIGSGNRKPSTVYARSTSLNVIHSDQPKIAIVLGGMGLNPRLTQQAIKQLPADITLAFAPYGNDLQSQVNAARGEGHEVLLQLPLEPVGFPASNPGPKTLLADAGQAENIEALYWHMSRFAGYVGITNYMGGRFLASPAALTPVLNEMRKRGLLFVEDGSLPLSAIPAVAKSTHADARRANTVIDSDPTPQSIASALQLLEQEAQANGFAIGTGSGLEVTIDAVRDWAKDASERGIIIIPVSAAFKGRLG